MRLQWNRSLPTWGGNCHLLDTILKLLPPQSSRRESAAVQAASVVQAPNILFWDSQAQNAIARARISHPALCKLKIVESEQRQVSSNCTRKWLHKHFVLSTQFCLYGSGVKYYGNLVLSWILIACIRCTQAVHTWPIMKVPVELLKTFQNLRI